jgi:hypothetical protein
LSFLEKETLAITYQHKKILRRNLDE